MTKIRSINPANGEQIAEYDAMSHETVDDIVQRANRAATDWRQVPVETRAGKIRKAGQILLDRRDEFALLITSEMGKPIKEARAEIEKCAWVCDYYAENGPAFLADEIVETDATRSSIAFEPLGVILVVMPWNFPFWQVFRFIAPGLTAGNGGVLKHASNVSGGALAVEEVLRQAGYPEDLFRTLLIPSTDVGRLLESEYIKAATLTGSEPAGKAVATGASSQLKKTVLELGGSDPYLVLNDADLELAADKCVTSRLLNCGQSCIAAKRFIVLPKVLQEFEERFVAGMKARRLGDPLDEATDIGPLARSDLREELHDQVQRTASEGARLLLGGEPEKGAGYFYPATVLSEVGREMTAATEETFGPVAAIIPASGEEQAVEIANESSFGLGAAVFTQDAKKGDAIARSLQAGAVFINDFVKSDPRLPFGGVKRSGYGRELARYGMHEFVNIKTLVLA